MSTLYKLPRVPLICMAAMLQYLRRSLLGFFGHHTGLGSPDLSGIFVDGAIAGELAHGSDILHYHLQPVFAVLGREREVVCV